MYVWEPKPCENLPFLKYLMHPFLIYIFFIILLVIFNKTLASPGLVIISHPIRDMPMVYYGRLFCMKVL